MRLDSWRVRQALVRWRLKTRISASFERASMAGLEQVRSKVDGDSCIPKAIKRASKVVTEFKKNRSV